MLQGLRGTTRAWEIGDWGKKRQSAAPGRRPTWFPRRNDCLKGTEKRDKRNTHTHKSTHTHTLVDKDLTRNNRSWHSPPFDHGFAILCVDSTVRFPTVPLYQSFRVTRTWKQVTEGGAAGHSLLPSDTILHHLSILDH